MKTASRPTKNLPLLLIKAGSAIHHLPNHGDFEQWIGAVMGIDPGHMHICRPFDGEELPAIGECAAAVITGSASMVTDRLDWSERCAAWLQRAVPTGLPILGICYGHQLLAHAMGGSVERDPKGREIGTVAITLAPAAQDDPLFGGLPSHFPAQVTHEESVLELPPGAVHLGSSEHTLHHVVRFGPAAWGVQFHPEFGPEEMKIYLRGRAKVLENEGLDPGLLLDMVHPGPRASSILEIFALFAGLR